MIEKLERIGLSRNEATVYLCLVEFGAAPAGRIIKRTRLHRNIVYENLDRLVEKGLARYVTARGVRQYIAADPEELERMAEDAIATARQNAEVAKKLSTELRERQGSTSIPADASVVKGVQNLKELLGGLASSRDEMLIFATGWGMKRTMKAYYARWHSLLKKRNIPGRAVMSKKMAGEEYPYRVRYLPEDYVLPATICVQGNKVVTIVWDDLLAIEIKSEAAASSYKRYFEMLWGIAKPPR